ncbi:MAG: DUF4293 domain-containing protein [Prevotella sp.]|nr:DUF4293 domain-containing protein [Prevotella sp.]
MIQRKQTLFLLLAVIVNIICLCLPVGKFIPEGMGVADQMFNLWIITGSGVRDFSVWALFAILLLTCPIAIAAIFMYRNRMLQARLCLFNMLLLLGWIIVYAVFSFTRGEQATFQPMFAACLPFISLILHFLAHRGIIADERLVRSMDRIR